MHSQPSPGPVTGPAFRLAASLPVPAAAGLTAALALLALYFGLLALLSGWDYTLIQFGDFWPYVTALAAGFGIQVGLFLFLRRSVHAAARTGKVVAVTGTASGAAMLSCCTHYLVNLLPVLGSTGIATLAGQYQIELFWVGLAANLGGIVYIARRVIAFSRSHGFAGHVAGAALAALLAGASGLAAGPGPAAAQDALPAQVINEGQVAVEVTPVQVAAGQPWRFEVQLNTHSVTLDQDMAASAVLLAGDGRELRAERWEGSPPGGHHRSGVLVFAAPDPLPDAVTLKIRGVGVPERVFAWPRTAQ